MAINLTQELPQEIFLHQSTIPSSHRFLLSSEDTVFLLEEGAIELYALVLDETSPHLIEAMQDVANKFLTFPGYFFPGPLQFIASFEKGEWLFPFSLNRDSTSHCILAVARGNTTVSCLSLSKLRPLFSQSPTLQLVTLAHMQEWIKRLNEMNDRLTQNVFPSLLNLYEKYQLTNGTTFTNFRSKETQGEQEICWLSLQQGSVYKRGIAALEIDQSDLFYPFTAHTK